MDPYSELLHSINSIVQKVLVGIYFALFYLSSVKDNEWQQTLTL